MIPQVQMFALPNMQLPGKSEYLVKNQGLFVPVVRLFTQTGQNGLTSVLRAKPVDFGTALAG